MSIYFALKLIFFMNKFIEYKSYRVISIGIVIEIFNMYDVILLFERKQDVFIIFFKNNTSLLRLTETGISFLLLF